LIENPAQVRYGDKEVTPMHRERERHTGEDRRHRSEASCLRSVVYSKYVNLQGTETKGEQRSPT
jgi:hypothetical protein